MVDDDVSFAVLGWFKKSQFVYTSIYKICLFVGSTGRDQSNENSTSQDSSNSNHLTKVGESKRHNPLSVLASKLFDEKVPLKKKVVYLYYFV